MVSGVALLASAMLLVPAGICPGLAPPVSGEVVRPYAPVGRYSGHWGIDIAAVPGTSVLAADAGVVTFAGDVAGVLSVTVHHGGGLRTSYSYLETIATTAGETVRRGSRLGTSGHDHDLASVHFSVRVGATYHDPELWLRCLSRLTPALSLVPPPAAYPAPRATRHPRGNVRSTPPCSPVCR